MNKPLSTAGTIPLEVLIVDADAGPAVALAKAMEGHPDVTRVNRVATLEAANTVLRRAQCNAIFIDPIAFGLDIASDFIFTVRKTIPHIVFVLYIDKAVAEANRNEFYKDSRRRFTHYVTLDKRVPIGAFFDEVDSTIRKCQRYLQIRASEQQLSRLQVEVVEVAQASDRSDGVNVAARIDEILSLLRGQKDVDVQKNTVFLSYRFAEDEYVSGLMRLLKKEGFEPVTGQSANTYISDAILERIKASEFFLCLMTRDKLKADGTYTTSPWLLEEKGVAIALGKRLVLMVEEGVDDIGGLQGDWQRIHFGPKGFLNAAIEAVSQLQSYAGTLQ